MASIVLIEKHQCIFKRDAAVVLDSAATSSVVNVLVLMNLPPFIGKDLG